MPLQCAIGLSDKVNARAQRGRSEEDQLNFIVVAKTRNQECEVLARHDSKTPTRVFRVRAQDVPMASPRPTSRIKERWIEESRLIYGRDLAKFEANCDDRHWAALNAQG